MDTFFDYPTFSWDMQHIIKGHFTHEPRAVTMRLWEPKSSVPRPSQGTTKSMYCKVICDWALNQMLFQWISIHVVSSHMIKYKKSTVMRFRSTMVSRFCVRSTSKRWFWKYSKWPLNMIHLMPCRNPCKLHIHLAFTYSVGPSRVVWSKLGPTLPFPPMRVVEGQWPQALGLICDVTPR